MKRIGLLVCCVASLVLAADPYVGIRALQPSSGDMISAYHVLPVVSIGARFPRSRHLAVVSELSGSYMKGSGDFADLSLWDASARFGAEFNLSSDLGMYLTPGMMLTYASERAPYADTLGAIGVRSYGGTGLGVFLNAGILLFRAGKWEFNIEFGGDVSEIPTDRAIAGYPYSYGNYAISLSGLSLGLVARHVCPSVETRRE